MGMLTGINDKKIVENNMLSDGLGALFLNGKLIGVVDFRSGKTTGFFEEGLKYDAIHVNSDCIKRIKDIK